MTFKKKSTLVLIFISLILVSLVFCIYLFFSPRVNVHYDNKNSPIKTTFWVDSEVSGTIKKEVKHIGGKVKEVTFRAPKSRSSSNYYFTSLYWMVDKKLLGRLDMLGELNQPNYNSSCRVDVYLDSNGKLINYKESDYDFLTLCW